MTERHPLNPVRALPASLMQNSVRPSLPIVVTLNRCGSDAAGVIAVFEWQRFIICVKRCSCVAGYLKLHTHTHALLLDYLGVENMHKNGGHQHKRIVGHRCTPVLKTSHERVELLTCFGVRTQAVRPPCETSPNAGTIVHMKTCVHSHATHFSRRR